MHVRGLSLCVKLLSCNFHGNAVRLDLFLFILSQIKCTPFCILYNDISIATIDESQVSRIE